MMQIILSPAHLWFSGIPAAVRLHPEMDGMSDPLEEIKGQCQFLKVKGPIDLGIRSY
jgi:hypothetical protein